jgi:hypothetical protein
LKVLLVLERLEESKMAGSNKYSYYSNSALQTTTFSQDQPVNTDWFDEVTRTGAYTQIIYPFQDQQKI